MVSAPSNNSPSPVISPKSAPTKPPVENGQLPSDLVQSPTTTSPDQSNAPQPDLANGFSHMPLSAGPPPREVAARIPCRYYAAGQCNRGASCLFLHATTPTPPYGMAYPGPPPPMPPYTQPDQRNGAPNLAEYGAPPPAPPYGYYPYQYGMTMPPPGAGYPPSFPPPPHPHPHHQPHGHPGPMGHPPAPSGASPPPASIPPFMPPYSYGGPVGADPQTSPPPLPLATPNTAAPPNGGPPSAPMAPTGYPPAPTSHPVPSRAHERARSLNVPPPPPPQSPPGSQTAPIINGGHRTFNGGGYGGPRRQSSISTRNGPRPPCCFFSLNRCKNGDGCTFPHIMSDGSDARELQMGMIGIDGRTSNPAPLQSGPGGIGGGPRPPRKTVGGPFPGRFPRRSLNGHYGLPPPPVPAIPVNPGPQRVPSGNDFPALPTPSRSPSESERRDSTTKNETSGGLSSSPAEPLPSPATTKVGYARAVVGVAA